MQSNFSNPISAGAQMSIKAFYHDFVNYMVENYSATPDQLMLDWNCIGATARYHGQNRTFEFVFGSALTDISESPTCPSSSTCSTSPVT